MKHVFSREKTAPVVSTRQGKVRGYCYDDLVIFKGIPYAQAKRFHAPQPVASWEGIFDAGSYGMVCPLLEKDKPNGEVLIPHRYWPTDENCQNLNIWTPGVDDGKRPVLVWLHGGGFSAGSSIEQVAYDGANMARLGNVVVVSVNHRLNILGYFDLSEYGEEYANSGNAGGDDIIAALSWVHDNIAAFGGDPECVTVFGQSGGGAKVTTLLQSPAADGLYARGMVMSGVVGKMLVSDETSAKPLAEAMMRELGVKTVREMETVDYFFLARAYRKVSPELQRQGKYVGCAPRKNDFYYGDPVEYGFRKETSHIPLLVGSVFGEFTSFKAAAYDRNVMTEEEQMQALEETLGKESVGKLLPLFRSTYPRRAPIDLLRLDFLFRAPEHPYLAARAKLNHSTWSYLFDMDQPVDGGSTPWHCCDIPYFFHNLDLVEYPHGETQPENLAQTLEHAMFESLMAFARTGNPQVPQLPQWPACEDGKEYTMILDDDPRVGENFDHELVPLAGELMMDAFQKAMEKDREALQH